MIISPKTKVGELLDSFPQLEPVLINMSPAFAKLKNPILRKTVAKVATLQQIAAVGGLNTEDIVKRLRKEVGQTEDSDEGSVSEYLSDTRPEWVDEAKIVKRFDASPVISSGGSPMNDILSQTNQLKSGEIFELQTPFVPAPVLDILKAKGFKIFCTQRQENVVSYVAR